MAFDGKENDIEIFRENIHFQERSAEFEYDSVFEERKYDDVHLNSVPMIQRSQRRVPYYTLTFTIAIWAIYLIAIQLEYRRFSTTRLAPANQKWWFYTITPFPQCADARNEPWRLLSNQFVHDGLAHIGGNTLGVLFYGSIFEIYDPYSFLLSFTLFQVSVVMGTLGFSIIFPYSGLIGCSPGVYGLIGMNISALAFTGKRYDKFLRAVLPPVLFLHLLVDAVLYFVSYSRTTAYSAHFFGLLSGILLYPAMAYLCEKENSWIVGVSVSILLFLWFVLFSILLTFYCSAQIPPVQLTNHYIFKNTNPSCCQQLFQFMQSHSIYTREEILQNSYCNGNDLIVFLP